MYLWHGTYLFIQFGLQDSDRIAVVGINVSFQDTIGFRIFFASLIYLYVDADFLIYHENTDDALLFSSVTFKMATKNYFCTKFFCLLLFEATFTSFFKDKKS
jgi:hypothetical protein